MAQAIRTDAMKRKIADPPAPLFHEFGLILRKCAPATVQPIRAIFEKSPLGLERLVAKLLDVAKRVTKEGVRTSDWLAASRDTATGATSRCASW